MVSSSIACLVLAAFFFSVQTANAATTTITTSYSESTVTSLGFTFTFKYPSTTRSQTATTTVSCPEGYGTLGNLCFAPASDYPTQPPSLAPPVIWTTTFSNLRPTTISNSITTWAPSTATITASGLYCPTPYVSYYRGGCYLPAEVSSLMAATTNTNRTVIILAESTTTSTVSRFTSTSGSVVFVGEVPKTSGGVVSVMTSVLSVGASATSAASVTGSASSVGTASTTTTSASAASVATAASTVAPNKGNGAGDVKAGHSVTMAIAVMAVAIGVVLML